MDEFPHQLNEVDAIRGLEIKYLVCFLSNKFEAHINMKETLCYSRGSNRGPSGDGDSVLSLPQQGQEPTVALTMNC